MAAGMNPMDLRRGINSAVEKVLSYLKQHAKMISTTEEIAQVCRQLRGLLSMYDLITLEASLQQRIGSFPILLKCARLLLSASTAIVWLARLLAARPKRNRGLLWALAHMVSMPGTEQGSFRKLQCIL